MSLFMWKVLREKEEKYIKSACAFIHSVNQNTASHNNYVVKYGQ